MLNYDIDFIKMQPYSDIRTKLRKVYSIYLQWTWTIIPRITWYTSCSITKGFRSCITYSARPFTKIWKVTLWTWLRILSRINTGFSSRTNKTCGWFTSAIISCSTWEAFHDTRWTICSCLANLRAVLIDATTSSFTYFATYLSFSVSVISILTNNGIRHPHNGTFIASRTWDTWFIINSWIFTSSAHNWRSSITAVMSTWAYSTCYVALRAVCSTWTFDWLIRWYSTAVALGTNVTRCASRWIWIVAIGAWFREFSSFRAIKPSRTFLKQ